MGELHPVGDLAQLLPHQGRSDFAASSFPLLVGTPFRPNSVLLSPAGRSRRVCQLNRHPAPLA